MFGAGGASQFNGNGFMPSPDVQAGGSAQKKNYDQDKQSVRKVSIRQICSALEQRTGDDIFLDGKELVNVSSRQHDLFSFPVWAVFLIALIF